MTATIYAGLTDAARAAPRAKLAEGLEQATGDFRIPQRGLLAVGSIYFTPLDPARHSTRLALGVG